LAGVQPFGRHGLGKSWVLGFWPAPDRVIGPTSAQRVGGLGSKEDAKRARQRPACTCAGRSWWALATHKPQRCLAMDGARPAASHLGSLGPGLQGSWSQGPAGSVEGKSLRKKTPISFPQRSSPSRRRRTRPKPATRPEPTRRLAEERGAKAGPADLSLPRRDELSCN